MGGRIAAEAFVGILGADPLSFVSVEPDWSPSQEAIAERPVDSMAELVHLAAPRRAERD